MFLFLIPILFYRIYVFECEKFIYLFDFFTDFLSFCIDGNPLSFNDFISKLGRIDGNIPQGYEDIKTNLSFYYDFSIYSLFNKIFGKFEVIEFSKDFINIFIDQKTKFVYKIDKYTIEFIQKIAFYNRENLIKIFIASGISETKATIFIDKINEDIYNITVPDIFRGFDIDPLQMTNFIYVLSNIFLNEYY